MKILITGIAGFIGFHLAKKLSEEEHEIIGIDNLNAYYDLNLKLSRLENLGIDINDILDDRRVDSKCLNISFFKTDLRNFEKVERILNTYKFDKIIHLAAQAGVRYSLKNPQTYIDNNIVAFYNLVELAARNHIEHFIFTSSSSVYGNKNVFPFSEDICTNSPVSIYAATKIADEIIAKAYSQLHKTRFTVLRLFTVYGSWGRPDMAYYIFTKKILENQPIRLFNQGNLTRDFTYIGDIIQGINLIINHPVKKQDFSVYNIGSGKKIQVIDMVKKLEQILGKKAKIQLLPMQQGDVYNTLADISKIKKDFGYEPRTDLNHGLTHFVNWYLTYHKIKD